MYVLGLAATVENASEHPLATAIVEEAKSKKIKLLKLSKFKSVTGKGVMAKVGKKEVLIGTRLLKDKKIN